MVSPGEETRSELRRCGVPKGLPHRMTGATDAMKPSRWRKKSPLGRTQNALTVKEKQINWASSKFLGLGENICQAKI